MENFFQTGRRGSNHDIRENENLDNISETGRKASDQDI